MTKPLSKYANEWKKNAEADAFWVILTDSRYYGKKWDIKEFFATGEEEIGRIFRFMERQSIKPPSGSFLDFGCGVGRASKALRERFQYGYGIDISPKMIDLARTHAENVEFIVNQTNSLNQFSDNSIDFIYSHIVLQHIPAEYQEKYIDEFLRILKPGGLSVFQVLAQVIHLREVKHSAYNCFKKFIKNTFPFLVSLKRGLLPPRHFHFDFKYELHPLSGNVIDRICITRECVVEASPATNSCDADHNGKVVFYDFAEHKKKLEESKENNLYLSRMYFMRKPAARNC
jgi:ubiquinone/menaquinone biosynthesis C-methylase UbiE